MKCLNCDIEFDGRKDAKFCSPKCRVTFSRKQSIVTDNVTFSEPDVTDNFDFDIESYNLNSAQKGRVKSVEKRTAKYWYDIPLGAKPIPKKGWPEMPDFMNGRQYFLWWKNEFKTNEKGEPMILNPYPQYDNPQMVNAAEGSRRWGS